MKKDLNIEEIKRLYTIDGKTTKEISEILGNCSLSTVNRALKSNGIILRNKGNIKGKEYNIVSPFKQKIKDFSTFSKLFYEGKPVVAISKVLNVSPKAIYREIKERGMIRTKPMMSRDFYDGSNDEEIIKLYQDGKSTTDIAKIFGVTHRTVIKHLEHCGIRRRTLSDSHYSKAGKSFPEDLTNLETVYDLYVVNRLSKKDIALQYNVSPNVIDRVLKKFNIRKRTSSEAKVGLFSGEKHPNWKGGRSGIYLRLREYFRDYQVKQVLDRDKYTCQKCGSKKNLQVHHIKYFKDIFEEIISEHPELDVQRNQNELFEIVKNDVRFNDLDNLITYCKECHLYGVHGYKKRMKK